VSTTRSSGAKTGEHTHREHQLGQSASVAPHERPNRSLMTIDAITQSRHVDLVAELDVIGQVGTVPQYTTPRDSCCPPNTEDRACTLSTNAIPPKVFRGWDGRLVNRSAARVYRENSTSVVTQRTTRVAYSLSNESRSCTKSSAGDSSLVRVIRSRNAC